MEAIYRADVVVTDTFVSMGKEEEKALRLKTFDGFQVNRKVRSSRIHHFFHRFVSLLWRCFNFILEAETIIAKPGWGGRVTYLYFLIFDFTKIGRKVSYTGCLINALSD